MTAMLFIIPAIGAVLGGVIGFVKARRVFLPAILGAGCGLVVCFFLKAGPGPVIALEETDDFDIEVIKSEKPVLVDFYADWCGPCRKLAPTIEKLADDYKGKIKVVKVDVDKHPALAGRFGIRGIPTVMLFVHGQVVQIMVGPQPEENYRREIDAVLNQPVPSPDPPY